MVYLSNSEWDMYVYFWGVRGSIPTPGPKTVKFGGNTSCVEVRPDPNTLIILDGGTGVRELGSVLMKGDFGKGKGEAHVFFSHTHWDHIQGFPFFIPAYIGAKDTNGVPIPEKSNKFHIYGRTNVGQKISHVMEGQMEYAFFPVALNQMGAQFNFHPVSPNQKIKIGKTVVKTLLVNHPGGSMSFRIENQKKVVVYCTDYEHDPQNFPDEKLVQHCRNADLLIYDCMYTTEEHLKGKIGWGHSTPEAGVALCKAANVKRFVLFHHDPIHDDRFIRKLERATRKIFPESHAAHEGMTLEF